MSAPGSPEVERQTQIVHPSLPDLDAALAWVVQTIESEGFDMPTVVLTPRTWWDEHDPDHKTTDYEVTVRQTVTPTRAALADPEADRGGTT